MSLGLASRWGSLWKAWLPSGETQPLFCGGVPGCFPGLLHLLILGTCSFPNLGLGFLICEHEGIASQVEIRF